MQEQVIQHWHQTKSVTRVLLALTILASRMQQVIYSLQQIECHLSIGCINNDWYQALASTRSHTSLASSMKQHWNQEQVVQH